MKFIVDAQLPPGLCRWLTARGHEAEHVHHLGLGAASDADVALRAQTDSATLITKDEDFLVLRLSERFPILWLRCGNVTNRALAIWLDERWDRIEALLAGGETLIEVR
jgi:predicted nuclease of predicted toxin-antitoxin system